MLRIGKLTDYAILILSQMAQSPCDVQSTSTLAEALNLSVPTVSKILKILADAGFVTSSRGAEGGYRLAREIESISLSEVIAAMEGALALTECCESSKLCAINQSCRLKANWQKINNHVNELLSRVSIKDMMGTLLLNEVRHV